MEEEIPSRTKTKQRMLDLQALGATLVKLPDGKLATVPMPEALAAAVREARRISSREGLRRQVQYIGRLMREIDAEPIRAALADLEGHSAQTRARQQQLERWRSRLIEDDAALTEYASANPGSDIQELRTLIRNARREIADAKPPRAQRELFRLLRGAR